MESSKQILNMIKPTKRGVEMVIKLSFPLTASVTHTQVAEYRLDFYQICITNPGILLNKVSTRPKKESFKLLTKD